MQKDVGFRLKIWRIFFEMDFMQRGWNFIMFTNKINLSPVDNLRLSQERENDLGGGVLSNAECLWIVGK